MRRLVLLLGLAGLMSMPVPAAAQQMIAQYYALLSPQDMYNSSGTRLGNLCQVLQQDRANYHRFGYRDDLDDWDPVFGSQQARSVLGSNCRLGPGGQGVANGVARGETRYVYVEVYGFGNSPSYAVAYEGAG